MLNRFLAFGTSLSSFSACHFNGYNVPRSSLLTLVAETDRFTECIELTVVFVHLGYEH